MNNYYKAVLLPILVGLIIFTGTCILNSNDVPDLPQGIPWDKIGHFGMFFSLSAISFFNYYRLHNGNPSTYKWIVWGFILPVIYGGVIELLQKHFFSSRSAEWGDFIADIIGSLAAMVLAFYLLKRQPGQDNFSIRKN